jgi:Ca2+-binding EF-hand superfamily protein
MTQEEVDDFIRRADVNKDGSVDYEEFLRLLTASE